MRSRYLLLAASFAAIACSPAPSAGPTTGTAADESQLRGIGEKYAAAFNARDPKMMAAIMSADYQEVDPDGKHLVGRDSSVAAMNAMWSNPQLPAAVKMTASTVYVKFLSGTSAVVGGTYAMNGMPGKGAWMAAATKQDSSWVIVSSLGAELPPEPTTTGAPPVVPTKPKP
jgi:uncharacterized protein (TIGR02246 family)